MPTPVQTGFSRLFLQDGRANPNNAPSYQSLWKAGGVSWPQGTPVSIKIPSPSQYNQFIRIGQVSGEQGDPSLTVTARYEMDRKSLLLALTRKGCEADLHIHLGQCENPQDFIKGWQKSIVLVGARVATYGTGDLGALQDSEKALVNEEVPLTGRDYYEIMPITFSAIMAGNVVQEVVAILVCDAPTCGTCGLPSDGCQVAFAVTLRAGGSPGLGANVVATQDGGSTSVQSNVTTLTGSDDPNGAACVGANLVIISAESCSLHYADIASIFAESESWAEVATGFDPSGCPLAIFSANPAATFIVGEGGFIYFTSDPTSSVTPQDSGSATSENLNAVHGIDEQNVVAVGDNNAVVVTRNGGATWQSITGPAAGDNLTAVAMRSINVWMVGTAAGELFYTANAGLTWQAKGFPGNGSGTVKAIAFSVTPDGVVGWMAHEVGGAGRILRSVDGGFQWYIAPEGTATLPANTRVNALATCIEANTLYAGGLAAAGGDGVVFKAS